MVELAESGGAVGGWRRARVAETGRGGPHPRGSGDGGNMGMKWEALLAGVRALDQGGPVARWLMCLTRGRCFGAGIPRPSTNPLYRDKITPH